MKRTGAIWRRNPRSRGQIVRRVCEKLQETYGRPRHGNPKDPLGDLIYIILSNQTPQKRALSVYRSLTERFPEWDDIIRRDHSELVDVLRPAGLAKKRSKQISSLLKQIRSDFGDLVSKDLWAKDNEELLSYLKRLNGVSDKVARCVMMYTLGREVLPVDVHVHRVAFRLGWTKKEGPGLAHKELESLLPTHRYYSFHVTCVAHGRSKCTASSPNCGECPIRRYCGYVNGKLSPPESD